MNDLFSLQGRTALDPWWRALHEDGSDCPGDEHPSMIALRTGVPVVPVAIWGSENMLKKFGAPVTISFGEPMVLTPKGKKITREDIDEATDKVMRKIAEMLPPEYRGVYGSSPDAV